MKAKPNVAGILLAKHLVELGIPFMQEFQFHKERKWRFDFLLTNSYSLAIEIEGGIWSRGRHVRGKGFQHDMQKYNTAMMMGYRCLRFSTEDVLTGRAKKFLKEHLHGTA